MEEIRLTSWGWSFIPLFTGFFTSQVPGGAGFLPSTVWSPEKKIWFATAISVVPQASQKIANFRPGAMRFGMTWSWKKKHQAHLYFHYQTKTIMSGRSYLFQTRHVWYPVWMSSFLKNGGWKINSRFPLGMAPAADANLDFGVSTHKFVCFVQLKNLFEQWPKPRLLSCCIMFKFRYIYIYTYLIYITYIYI